MRIPCIVSLTLAILGCDLTGTGQIPDPAYKIVYFVHCDSVFSGGACYGPYHRVNQWEFTVSVARQEVIPGPGMTVFDVPMKNCTVASASYWDCTRERDRMLISVRGSKYSELCCDVPNAAQLVNTSERDKFASVSKVEYFGFWSALIH